MQTFGYKIVDESREEIAPVVSAAIDQQRPLEVGLYFGNPAAWGLIRSSLREASVPIPVNTHLDHQRLSLFHIAGMEEQLHQQLTQAQEIGSTYSITHLHNRPTSQRPAHRKALAEHLTRQLRVLEAVCAEHQHPIHIENTYHNLEFYRWFFDLVERLELRHIHHCFDIGHAKIWSLEKLPQWFLWLRELADRGFRIHFHLHANNGLADQHLSFVETEAAGMNRADSYTLKWDYFEAMAELREHFPASRKVFEVKPWQALENMALVMGRLGR
ncbi:MAG: sugar phosphate isomerase/epimerase [Candidatus Thiothrix singaporensis]|uniref:Sugar phosphate isomerase/epimerase n=1 Tax=Candidatus Thiothrix singaporensis TaxID=2799669 RepID=A0A7L6AS65_9GAMM|nr:MAG: sugar phosphate isomerase/epimerase [Candidatus Thiothrix singaporensis]